MTMLPPNDRHEDGGHQQPQSREAPGLVLVPQECPFDDPSSRFYFLPSPAKPFAVTPGALNLFGMETILACLYRLQTEARHHQGLAYLQYFESPGGGEALWFVEDDDGGTITALLESEY